MQESKYLNPFTDYGFKKLFGEENSKDLLIDFLNSILSLEFNIVDISFKPNEHQGDTCIDRKVIYDIFCQDESGDRFIVEMQNAKQLYFKDRALYYATFPIREAAKKGDWDFELPKIYCIGILNFEFDTKYKNMLNLDRGYFVDDEYFSEVKLKNQKDEVFYDKLTFVYIELPKFNKNELALSNNLEKWLYFLKNLESLQAVPKILNTEIFKKAFSVAEVAKLNKPQLAQYESSLQAYRDNNNAISFAKEAAVDEYKTQIILGMLDDEVCIDLIAKYTKTNKSIIDKMNKDRYKK